MPNEHNLNTHLFIHNVFLKCIHEFQIQDVSYNQCSKKVLCCNLIVSIAFLTVHKIMVLCAFQSMVSQIWALSISLRNTVSSQEKEKMELIPFEDLLFTGWYIRNFILK